MQTYETISNRNPGEGPFFYCYIMLVFKLFRRNCKRNPHCILALGEKRWINAEEEENQVDDIGEFREEGEFAGLQNLGATCYVNCLLQLWFHNPIIR